MNAGLPANVIPLVTPPRPKPFLKWVGGKRQLLPELMARVPAKFKHYYEPFIGGAALFFELRARGWKGHATIGDANELLARTYIGVRNDVESVIDALSGMGYNKNAYLARRANMPGDNEIDEDVAAWFIYMNRCCFNGLWRVNKSGRFNVPFGKYTNPTICDAEGLRVASKALRKTRFFIGGFEKTVRSAEAGDFVYFDPPYVPASASADFTGYTADGFTHEDQARLRDLALSLKTRGVHVMMSNSDTPAVHKLYDSKYTHGFKVERVSAKRNINSRADKRGAVGEVIIT